MKTENKLINDYLKKSDTSTVVRKYKYKKWDMSIFIIFLDFPSTESFFYWIQIRNKFFQILDPDQKDRYGSATLVFAIFKMLESDPYNLAWIQILDK